MIKNITVVSIFSVIFFSFLGCGEEGLVDPHGEVELSPPSSEGFQAADFPTNNGSAWTYLNVGFGLYNPGQEEVIQELLEETFTIRIEGTRDISGFTHRQATVSEIKTVVRTDRGEEERVFRAAVDHLSANARYFRIDFRFSGGRFAAICNLFPEHATDLHRISI